MSILIKGAAASLYYATKRSSSSNVTKKAPASVSSAITRTATNAVATARKAATYTKNTKSAATYSKQPTTSYVAKTASATIKSTTNQNRYTNTTVSAYAAQQASYVSRNVPTVANTAQPVKNTQSTMSVPATATAVKNTVATAASTGVTSVATSQKPASGTTTPASQKVLTETATTISAAATTKKISKTIVKSGVYACTKNLPKEHPYDSFVKSTRIMFSNRVNGLIKGTNLGIIKKGVSDFVSIRAPHFAFKGATKVINTVPNNYNPADPAQQYVTKEQLESVYYTQPDGEVHWAGNISNEQTIDLNRVLERYEINTSERIAHFIGQCSIESHGGEWLVERGTKEYKESLWYSPYIGSGYLQLTGINNYKAFSKVMDDPLIVLLGPEYVARYYPWEAAGWHWQENSINELIDKNASCSDITKAVRNSSITWEMRKEAHDTLIEIINNE